MTGKPLIESDRVEGTYVYDPNGKHIGTIKRLMIDKINGKVAYALMSFGGILGMGAEEHTIPWDKLSYAREYSAYRTDITREQVLGAPVIYGDDEIFPPEREKAIHDYWRDHRGPI